MRLLIVALLFGCAGPPPQSEEPTGPPGSHLVGCRHVYFEHSVDGGWERIGLVGEDGGAPARYSTAKGTWYFPADAGPMRILVDP